MGRVYCFSDKRRCLASVLSCILKKFCGMQQRTKEDMLNLFSQKGELPHHMFLSEGDSEEDIEDIETGLSDLANSNSVVLKMRRDQNGTFRMYDGYYVKMNKRKQERLEELEAKIDDEEEDDSDESVFSDVEGTDEYSEKINKNEADFRDRALKRRKRIPKKTLKDFSIHGRGQKITQLKPRDTLDLRPDGREKEDLFPYQQMGYHYLLKNSKSILAHTMGAGKTKTLIRVCQTLIRHSHKNKQGVKILVVCPKSITDKVWGKECYKWGINRNISVNLLTSGAGQLQYMKWRSDQSNITITNTEFFRNKDKYTMFLECPPDLLIADEVHTMMGEDSQQYSGLKEVAKKASRVYLASGTPMRNNPKSMYNLIDMLHLSDFPISKEEFEKLFDIKLMRTNLTKKEQERRMYMLHKLLSEDIAHFVSERKLKSCLNDLPQLYETFVSVEMDKKQHDKLKNLYYPKTGEKAKNRFSSNATAENIARDTICDAICLKIIYENIVNEKKVAVILSRISWIDQICSNLETYMKTKGIDGEDGGMDEYGLTNEKGEFDKRKFEEVRPVKTTGSTTPEQQEHGMNRFQKSAMCYIGQITISSVGIDLTAADVLILTPDYDNNKTQQAMKRIHRISPLNANKDKVDVMHISVDATPLEVVQRRRKECESAFNSFFDPASFSGHDKAEDCEKEFSASLQERDFERTEPFDESFVSQNCPEFRDIKVTNFDRRKVIFTEKKLSDSDTQLAFNEFCKSRQTISFCNNIPPYVMRYNDEYRAKIKKPDQSNLKFQIYLHTETLPMISFKNSKSLQDFFSANTPIHEEMATSGQVQIPNEYCDKTIVIRAGKVKPAPKPKDGKMVFTPKNRSNIEWTLPIVINPAMVYGES
jgi:superfamily II DNA or RNA helicase